MKKIISVICAVILLLSSVSVSAFALTKSDADAQIVSKKKAFDSAFSQDITAGDARNVLLTSAGLVKGGVDTKFFDIDSDGKITAIDARTFLRIAARLENINNYYSSVKYDYFLALINSVKPSAYRFYESMDEVIEKVNYVDYSDIVKQMNTQIGYYAEYDESMVGYDFGAELRASEGKTTRSYIMSQTQVKNETNYPIKERELACYAPFDNVKSVEYKTNQTFTFERHSAVSDTKLYEETVTGLDSITVYFNSESISLAGTLTDQMFKNMKMGQAFDILQKSDVDAMLEANSSISGIEGMEEMGTCEVSLTPKNLEYKNSYITIYFDPATCTPVATVHNLHYVVTMNMFMNIDISAKNLAGDSLALEALLTLLTLKNKGKLLDVHGTMDISNEMNTRSVVYFTDNNINHIPY